MKYTSAIDAALIGVLGPLMSVVAGHYYYKEKINRGMILGLSLTILGLGLIIFKPIITEGGTSAAAGLRIFGNLMILAHVVGFLLYTVWSKMTMGKSSSLLTRTFSRARIKPMTKNYSPFIIVAVSFFVGLATIIPFAVLESHGFFGYEAFSLANLSITPIVGLLYMALISSIAAYYLYAWALQKATVGDTAIFSYLTPVFTLPFAYILLAEVPTPLMLYGAAIIASGVVIAEKTKS